MRMIQFTGSYELEYENGCGYYTFTPRPLSDFQIAPINEEIYSLLVTAHRKLGILEGQIRTMPNLDQYSALLFRYEAVLSCQMSGIYVSMFDLWDVYSKNMVGISKVDSYLSAVQYGLAHISKTNRFCKTYRILTGCQDSSDMTLLRKEQIYTEPRVFVLGTPMYNPPNPEKAKEAYWDFEKYWNATHKYDFLIQAALIYYQFSTIQPFAEDNDRMTRILTNLFWVKTGILSQPLLCLSYFLSRDRVGCVDRLNHVRRYLSDSYESWIKYFIQAIIISAEKTNDILALLEKTRHEDSFQLSVDRSLPKRALTVYEGLWDNPIVETRQVANRLNVSYNTAAKIVNALVALGILKQIGEQRRYRRFVYQKLLDIFTDT